LIVLYTINFPPYNDNPIHFLSSATKQRTDHFAMLQLIISDGLHSGRILFARRTKGNCVEIIRTQNILKLSHAIKAAFLTSSWQSFLLLAPSKKKLYKFGRSEGKVVFVHDTTAKVGLEL
jgi:hypothetical protein